MNELALLDLVVEQHLETEESAVFLGTSVPPAWIDRFGPSRVRTCPISEPAMVGMGVGAAIVGLRPLIDLNRASFVYLVADQLVNHAAKLPYMSNDQYSMPLVVTSATRGDQQLGPQNEQCPYGIFMQIPGIDVVVPGSPSDAVGLLRQALLGDRLCLFFVAPNLRKIPGSPRTALNTPPLPFGRVNKLRSGDAATIIGIGGASWVAVCAAEALHRDGLECDVLDPRTLAPLDVSGIAESVKRTRRLVVVDDGPRSGAAAQILSRLHDVPGLVRQLAGNFRFVGSEDAPVPSSPTLEASTWPTVPAVVKAVHDLASRSLVTRRGQE